MPRSAIIGAATVEGVERVVLTEPVVDAIADPGALIEVSGVTVGTELVDG